MSDATTRLIQQIKRVDVEIERSTVLMLCSEIEKLELANLKLKAGLGEANRQLINMSQLKDRVPYDTWTVHINKAMEDAQ